MSTVERHWVELLLLVVLLGGWALYRQAFAHVPLRRKPDDRDTGL